MYNKDTIPPNYSTYCLIGEYRLCKDKFGDLSLEIELISIFKKDDGKFRDLRLSIVDSQLKIIANDGPSIMHPIEYLAWVEGYSQYIDRYIKTGELVLIDKSHNNRKVILNAKGELCLSDV